MCRFTLPRIQTFVNRACLPSASALLLSVLLSGCTLYAPGKPALATTTSAEQTQRLFWENVKTHKWQTIQGLLTANIVWRNGSQTLNRSEVVPYLQQLQVKDYLITNVVVRSNANDMTILYDIQLTTSNQAQPVNLHAVAVWQQPSPIPADAGKKQKKQSNSNAPYLLTVEDLVPDLPHS